MSANEIMLSTGNGEGQDIVFYKLTCWDMATDDLDHRGEGRVKMKKRIIINSTEYVPYVKRDAKYFI